MCLLGKKQILFARDFLAAVHTAKKLRHQSLLRHSAKLKNAPHQPRIQLRIQKGFHSQVKKIHHILLICALMSEVIRTLQEIVAIVNSRLPGCQFHKMMGHGHLVQIVAAAPLKKGKIPEYKGIKDGKATFYPNFAALQNREAGKTQEQQKTEDTAKKQAYGKEQRKRRAEVRARLKKVETEIEELGAHIVELENEINDPEVLRDHLLLRDKCDELDDTRFHQQELYDEWEKLAEEQESFDSEGE